MTNPGRRSGAFIMIPVALGVVLVLGVLSNGRTFAIMGVVPRHSVEECRSFELALARNGIQGAGSFGSRFLAFGEH